MIRYLTESFVWRACAAVYAWLCTTWLARGIRALGAAWRASAVYRFWAKLLKADSPVERSAFARLSQWCNDVLHRMGGDLRSAYEGSFYRNRALPYLQKSFLLGKLLSGGVTGVLLICASSYAIIDYLLRDVFQLTGIASVWDEGLILLCAMWLVVQRAGAPKSIKNRANSVDLFLAFYMIAGAVLLVFTSHTYWSINITGYRASMQYILLFFFVVRLIRNDTDFMRMYKLMIAIAALLSIHGVYQFIIGVEIPSHWTDLAEGSVRTRVFSIFSNPNIMGAYMILFAPMAIGMAYAEDDLGCKIFYWICGLAMCVACLFTMSRGAWLALAISALIFALLIDRRLFVLLLAGGVLACFLPFVRSRIGYLFTHEFTASNQRGGRSVRWETALGYLTDYKSWTKGLGYGMYGGAVAVENQINKGFKYMYVDNYYVKILAENGILGLSAFLTMLSGLLWNCARACGLTAGTKYRPLCAGMFAALVGILVHSFFESLWEEPYMMALFFIVTAMLIYAGFLRQPREDGEK